DRPAIAPVDSQRPATALAVRRVAQRPGRAGQRPGRLFDPGPPDFSGVAALPEQTDRGAPPNLARRLRSGGGNAPETERRRRPERVGAAALVRAAARRDPRAGPGRAGESGELGGAGRVGQAPAE